mmetsp:Transcript_14880/g.23017  ORF Transcript_14880/g.23017 Transcript_14880/m.23017 type:complete len:309 (-) Transcript_14880:154-1080(-)
MKNTAFLLAVSVVNQSTAFLVPSSPSSHHHHLTTTTTTTLHSTASTPEQLQLLTSASLCANSESCSIESAELYLREIISVQAGCVAGSTAGEEDVVCSDVGRTSEVVAGLREKIRRGAVKENAAFWENRQQEFETLLTSSLDPTTQQLSPTASLTQAPLKPAYLALAALYTILIISTVNPPPMMDVTTAVGGVVPFTPQEVWWAIRDGYIGELTSHLVRNGGLVVGDTTANAANAVVASSLTPQEVWWSIRDGYADDTLFSNGVVLDLGENGGGGVVPLKPQEVYWAVRDGYVGDLIGHWFRNGGLSV